MNQCSEHSTSFGGGCGINEKLESLYSGSPIYLMSNIYQVTSQCGLNASMEDFYLPLREKYLGLELLSQVEPFLHQEEEWATFMMDDIMKVGNFGRAEYVLSHRGWLDAWRNYRWVARRCYRLGFVCPSEARWWMVSKITRFFWKKTKEG